MLNLVEKRLVLLLSLTILVNITVRTAQLLSSGKSVNISNINQMPTKSLRAPTKPSRKIVASNWLILFLIVATALEKKKQKQKKQKKQNMTCNYLLSTPEF